MNLPDPQDQDDLLDLGLSTAFRPALTPLMASPEARPAAPAPPEAPPAAPPAAIGRYQTRNVVARGGMGLIVRAHDPELQRDVAIKLLHGRAASDPAMQRLFAEEARVMGQLEHPGIVPVHDQGRLPDGRPYYVMHLIAGQSLQELLKGSDRRKFLNVFARVCDTVAFAHSRNVVHGDLKPANIMVGAFGEVQVLDWGFARASRAPGESDRPRILGTPAYMAPEQARGDVADVDARADVFGLGGVLCEILTGAPPYQGSSREEVLLRASQGWLDGAIERLAACGADPELVALTRRCLDRDPAARPADAGQVAREVHQHLAALARRAQDLALEAAQAGARAEAEGKARRRTVIAAVVVIAALALGAALLIWQQGREAALRAAAEQRVAGALARATLLRDRARAGGEDESSWPEAAAVAREAEQAASSAEVSATLRGEASALRRETEAAAGSAARLAHIRRLLDEVRPHLGEQATGGDVEAGYRELARSFGIDVEDQSASQAAAALRSSPLATHVARALHEWAHLRGRLRGDAQLGVLLGIADALDPDAWRMELRRLCRNQDATALRALADQPDLARASGDNLGLLARCLNQAGERDAAVRVFRMAHLHHPGDYWICHDLAELLWNMPERSRPEVTRLFSVAAAVRPRSVHALVDLSQALLEQDDAEAARVVAERARALDPGYPRLWAGLALIREGLKDAPGAVEAVHELIRLAPRRTDSYVLAAQVLRRAGRPTEVLSLARAGVAALPDAELMQRLLGTELDAAGFLHEAIQVLQAATGRWPDNGLAWYDLGVVLSHAGRYADAASAYRKALEHLPDHAESLCNLGLALAESGEFAEALALLRKGAEIGQRRHDWAHPTDTWIAEVEHMAALEPTLQKLNSADDVEEDTSPAARAELGDLARRKDRPTLAFGLLRDALARDPGGTVRWFDAALAASALAAADTRSEEHERARAARQAQAWLRQAARSVQSNLDDETVPPHVARRVLDVWLNQPALAPVRDQIATLPGTASEREAWEALWQRIRELRKSLASR